MALVPRINPGDVNPVGMIIPSMLTLAQFQAQNGTQWVLADGSSASGTLYASITGNANLPDLRGVVLRGKNNGRSDGSQNPGGDNALGTFENDNMQGHRHIQNEPVLWGAAPSATPTRYVGTTTEANSGTPTPPYNGSIGDPNTDGTNGTPRTGLETRMKNVTVNHFIKIN